MTFRLVGYGEPRSKIQFTSFARMPNLIYRACHATSTVSNTAYIQKAVCEALARDLDLPLQDLLDECPPHRGIRLYDFGTQGLPIDKLQSGGRVRIGPANTNEETR